MIPQPTRRPRLQLTLLVALLTAALTACGGSASAPASASGPIPPSLASLDPGHVPATGGTVILHGDGFEPGARVLFGADTSAGDARWIDRGQLVAVAAAHAPGIVDVTVVNPDGERTTIPSALQFDANTPPPPPPPPRLRLRLRPRPRRLP